MRTTAAGVALLAALLLVGLAMTGADEAAAVPEVPQEAEGLKHAEGVEADHPAAAQEPMDHGAAHRPNHHEEAQRLYEARERARMARMSPEERERYEEFKRKRDAYEKEHKGHEAMHFEMFLVLVGTLVLAQILLTMWKKRHFASYQAVTLLGLWIFPIYFAILHEVWRLILTWALYTLITGYVSFLASQRQLSVKTPRKVYWYFVVVIKLTGFIGITGYVIAVFDFFIGPYLPQPANMTLMSLGLNLLFYGLYYGVMTRDFADITSRWMATSIGYYSPSGMTTRQLKPDVCAVCGDSLRELEDVGEKRATLPCGHVMHDFCIRGWCIIGKKQTCPYCKEKVRTVLCHDGSTCAGPPFYSLLTRLGHGSLDLILGHRCPPTQVDLREQFPSPWSRTDVMYGQLLDICRYFVVWYPVIIQLVQGEFYVLGLH
ncbi:uncharacterized protein MONBRDRAFT_38886 [Monosiga brevicollis MX1]|uniref:RING-type domain-containing protein n=1 Tax=Monosiga brevicollis TaxID=81824 RepID=A9VAT1_MONBE|nr:uncharacterized protein MONBRDRAFT_38886 [Monosiga brevicollis MX1]EDQ85429.1 predicted protein [Monosiga brevicollis MX1]|eukprot:XP_001749840.1 hypothetical protein [Monosiga brevicollis MX1]